MVNLKNMVNLSKKNGKTMVNFKKTGYFMLETVKNKIYYLFLSFFKKI